MIFALNGATTRRDRDVRDPMPAATRLFAKAIESTTSSWQRRF